MIHRLFESIRNKDSKAVRDILEDQPLLVNEKDLRGSTPLLLATYFGFAEISEIILQYPQHIDVQDVTGNSALMGVCFRI